VKGLVYASSIAVFGSPDRYPEHPVRDDACLHPETLYGVYKQANENAARIFWQDWGLSSIGLRPFVVYGVGRDQGITSDLSKALLAAAAGRAFHIRFGGVVALQYADDVARILVDCAKSGFIGAKAFNMRNDVVTVEAFVDAIRMEVPGAKITFERGKPLPFPADLSDSGLRSVLGKIPHTPMNVAISETIRGFRGLIEEERVRMEQLAE
jgi:nucleoside-diphosphate-sugar epimerase